MYEENPGEIDFGSSCQELTVYHEYPETVPRKRPKF